MARAALEPYGTDDDTPPDTLGNQLSAVLNGQKSDPLLAQIRAGLESAPAGSLSAAEDAFARDMERANSTPTTPDTWSNA